MSRSVSLRSLRATYRLSAFVVALVWGTTPVLAILHSHSSVEVHRYCAEHRTLEDVAEDEAQAPAASNPDSAVSGESEAAGPHNGCVFGHFSRLGDLRSGLGLEATGVLEGTPVLTRTVRVVPASIPVIVVAPKTSPPV